ncbi:hypothetical protein MMC29_008305 [Sticta canariensis]|nr:hypothetical protein [Sticta canariensis]
MSRQPASAAAGTKSTDENLPIGLKVLAEGIDPVLDIVAVHGLNGHREKTWTVNEVNWLRDFLPSDVPRARILTWGYDANTHSTSQISCQYLYDHARTLISDLCLKRRLTKSQTRAIVFIAHSLGGIVVKSALIHSDAARRDALEEHRSIKLSTYGILFMGTPHQGGGGVHLGELLLKVGSIFVADDKIIKHLEKDSEWLQQQLSQYGPISRDFVTKFAYEMYPTPVALGKTIMVVPQASAIIPGIANAEPVAIPADHLNMVKFASREDAGYEKMSGYLQLLAEEAPSVIDTRWTEQDRIREVLSNTSEDFSISFSLSGVPEIESLIGREEETRRIKEAFQGDGSHRETVILQGLGGIGKTQLAAAFVKERRDYYSAMFWLNGTNEDILKKNFFNLAKRLHDKHPSSTLLRTALESEDADQVVGAVKQWLSAKGNTRWILVFDNIDNPKLPGVNDPQAYDLRSYFPEAHQGFILITTRSSRLRPGKVIQVKKLQNVRDSIAILAQNSQRRISDQDPHAIKLVQKLDGLPLALATAGAYLSQVSTSLADYLRYYDSSWLRLQETSPELPSYEDRALYSTWDISYQHICSQNESAGKLLKLWAYFDNQDLWYTLLADKYGPAWFSAIADNELSFNVAIRLLCDHTLIESHEVSGGYSMHSCVHAWTINVLNSEQDISMINLALCCVGFTLPQKTSFGSWALQRRLLSHANRCLGFVRNSSVLGAEKYCYNPEALHNLGALYIHQGKPEEAEEIYLRALAGQEKAWGPEHPSTLDTINDLGFVYLDRGKMDEAEEMYRRALAGRENALGPDHPSTLDTIHNVGVLYKDQGKLDEAEEMHLRALAGTEKALGPEHQLTLETINNLGVLYKDQGKLDEAEEMFRRALAGNEKASGPEHPSTLVTINNLGVLYKDQGKMYEAEDIFRRALAGEEKALGPEHRSTLDTIHNLGSLYIHQGKLDEAEEMYLRALAGNEKALGPEHRSTLDTIHNVGVLYKDQGKLDEAEEMYRRALAGNGKTRGPEHKLTLDTRYNLAVMYQSRSLIEDATKHFRLVVQDYTNTLGPDHQDTMKAMSHLETLQQ